MKEQTKSKISEVLKIRYFVMNLFYRNGAVSVRIPSSRELSAHFGVARSTVQLALEKMTAEGYLIGRPGIGTFTNPRMNFQFPEGLEIPLIGIKVQDGDNFYYGHTLWQMISMTGQALTDAGFNIRLLNNSDSSVETIAAEIKHYYLDALLCIELEDNVVRQLSPALPLVAVDSNFSEINSIEYSTVTAISRLMAVLQRKGCRKHMILGQQNLANHPLRELTRLAPEFHVIPEVNLENPEIEARLLLEFRGNCPCAIIASTHWAIWLSQKLAEWNIDPTRCIIISTNPTPASIPFTGYAFARPIQQIAESAAIMMEHAFQSKHWKPQYAKLEFKLYEYNGYQKKELTEI